MKNEREKKCKNEFRQKRSRTRIKSHKFKGQIKKINIKGVISKKTILKILKDKKNNILIISNYTIYSDRFLSSFVLRMEKMWGQILKYYIC